MCLSTRSAVRRIIAPFRTAAVRPRSFAIHMLPVDGPCGLLPADTSPHLPCYHMPGMTQSTICVSAVRTRSAGPSRPFDIRPATFVRSAMHASQPSSGWRGPHDPRAFVAAFFRSAFTGEARSTGRPRRKPDRRCTRHSASSHADFPGVWYAWVNREEELP